MASRVLAPRLARLPLRRNLQTAAPAATSRVPGFAFAFDIDGVLVRSSDALPRAHQTLSYLHAQRIPFILLTNGGGKHETERVADLTRKLRVPLDTSMFVQSHTPFADMDQYKDKTVMVVGGEEDKCRHVAEAYGFKTVVTPGDILAAYPDVWPFSQQLLPYYKTFTRPLPAPIDPSSPSSSLRIDAVFVYNDPRDWGLDAQIIKDVLLSERGILGTLSAKNGNATLPNKGYQQDGQPPLYFSNPDLLWAAKYHLPRLGQGGFREALEGIWSAVTGGEREGVKLQKVVMGKPYKPTYEFAEKRLIAHRAHLLQGTKQEPEALKRVYMVGDNPASDIAGGNNYESPYGTDWASILVSTGVYVEGRRGATAAHTAKERLPVGTPHSYDKPCQLATGIAPAAKEQAPKSDLISPRHPTKDPVKAFTDQTEQVKAMALRGIDEFEDDQGDHSGVSLAGIIKLQPNRRKMNKSWRPMQACDLGEARDTGDDISFRFADTHGYNDTTTNSEPQQSLTCFQLRPSTFSNATSAHYQLGGIDAGVINIEGTALFAGARDKVNNQGEAPPSTEATRMRLFGDLPDLIRLSEQVGTFDGQVVFIGHPNRDISAHQWSSSSFEWVNIGRYSHSQGKVEGSLASDRLRGVDELHDTIEHFKLAAENRQALVIERGRPEKQDTVAGPALRGGIGFVGHPHVSQDPSTKTFRITDQARSGTGPSLRPTAHTVFAKDVLEDPFIVAADVSLAQATNDSRFPTTAVNSSGPLDLTYRFPMKLSADVSVTGSSALSLKAAGSTSGLSSTSGLREVAFGEEAASRRGPSFIQDARLQQCSSNTSYQPYDDHLQTSAKLKESRITMPWYKDVAADFKVSNPATRSIAPSRPALSTTYTSLSLDAAAAPYSQASAGKGMTATSESTTSTLNAPGIALHYSDPDGLRKTQQYEVANGLTQQAPTAQTFKGPFFTDSKPTTHDPTASLSVHVSEEEKLITWFRDGYRPTRQKEYAKSLIAAAVAADKSRHLGAIGGASAKSEDGPYANTGPFVRLYENLSEYVEEHRNGGGHSYFTRRWKPAAPQLREPGPEPSRSYFGKGGNRPLWPGATLLRPTDRQWV
ncbi:hypothetical protein E8E12_002457 [Didymella heteroderae]|uniref:Hydrolase n=1 Tax=Didymella heteroderae TaxID=1769908 RepID=A0A9P5BZ37_9PLEO|nr:hypothetical protein E8E12_002457 [Didymella heteroderae]